MAAAPASGKSSLTVWGDDIMAFPTAMPITVSAAPHKIPMAISSNTDLDFWELIIMAGAAIIL